MAVPEIAVQIRLRNRTIGIPFDVVDLVTGKQVIQHFIDKCFHFRFRQIQHVLTSRGVTRSRIKVINPVRMLCKQLRRRIDHFRLDPDAEHHTEGFYFTDQLVDTVREFFFVDIPVAETVVDAVPLAEPAVIHNEQLCSKLLCFFRQLFLLFTRYPELRCLPGIVEHRTKTF